MNIYKIWLLIASSAIAKGVICQSDTTKMFDDDDVSISSETISREFFTVNNGLSINLCGFAIEEYAVSYERRISKKISAVISAGFTRSKRSHDTFNDAERLFDFSIDPRKYDLNYKLAPMLHLGVKYYFQNHFFSGWYVSPVLVYKKYNLEYSNKNAISFGEFHRNSNTLKGVRVDLGYVLDLNSLSSSGYEIGTIDLAFGVGYTNVESLRVLEGRIDNNIGPDEYSYNNAIINNDRLLKYFSLRYIRSF
jgi:hypothetical protein